MTARRRLKNRRPSEVTSITWRPRYGEDPQEIEIGIGFFPDGRPAEVFATDRKSDIDAMVADACVVLSIALQHGVEPAAYLRSIGRQALPPHVERENPSAVGLPLTVIGAIVELLDGYQRRAEERAGSIRKVLVSARDDAVDWNWPEPISAPATAVGATPTQALASEILKEMESGPFNH